MSERAKAESGPVVIDERMYSNVVAFKNVLDAAGEVVEINNADQFHYHYFQCNVTDAVVLRVEGTLDGDNWFNMDSDNTDTTIAAIGTYLIDTTRGIRPVKIRLKYVSGTGSVTPFYRGGN